ncbi:unnamed protein product [Ectocarpus sp. 12 AP-2014]
MSLESSDSPPQTQPRTWWSAFDGSSGKPPPYMTPARMSGGDQQPPPHRTPCRDGSGHAEDKDKRIPTGKPLAKKVRCDKYGQTRAHGSSCGVTRNVLR